MEENNNVVEEIMKEEFEEAISNEKTGRRLRSDVWESFSKLPGGKKAKCNYCKKEYVCESVKGTSGLRTHLEKRCPVYKKVKPKADENQCALAREKGVGNAKLVSVGFSKEACRKALVKMIIKDELPFKFVEAEGFLEFMATCCPKFDVPSRRTITRDILQLHENEKKMLKSMLTANRQRVCITTDTWTSIQMCNYMVITAHFIDKKWNLHKRILSFAPISSHKGEAIGKLIEKCMIDWGIESLFTITVDNASANEKAVNYLKKKLGNWSRDSLVLNGSYLHVRCSAHIINLIVKEGLDAVKISIESIRNAVKYVRSSPSRLQKFKACVDAEKISYNGFMVLDVPTRWNSTFLMLRSALKFEKAFDRLKDEDGHYVNWFGADGEDENENEKYKVGPPMEDDWNNARRLVKFLAVFYDVTLKFSGSKFVTANNYLNEMWKVQIHLKSLDNSDDVWLSYMVKPMITKFVKYWGDNLEKVNMLLILAAVLDPQCKMDFVTWCFSSLYDTKKVEELCNGLKELLMKLYQSYNCRDPNSAAKTNCMVQTSGISECARSSSLDPFAQYKMMKASTQDGYGGQNEVDKYLSDKTEMVNDDFDILNWWSLNWHRYPILSQIAKDILAIPVSTVASESAFSTGGRILDPFRSSLTPKTVESLICTQNWLRATLFGDRIIEPTEEETEFYEVVEAEFVRLMLAQQAQAAKDQLAIE